MMKPKVENIEHVDEKAIGKKARRFDLLLEVP